ncbi:hypothetical protein MNAB215_298 [Mycobacterium numidiamassiliense]|uniref:Uncharacterized protein n=1 Tax=Mycobacterium numidiamassiliense TaxID=1841861 RepID=A0A2U3P2Y0_9MYCO|nr:hypothetical protein [Mycobacterium numidiamassiliense]SPM38122.1 hypothetical protein MNAB215_298 [Mycobacterium numidiamassiliense]
MGGLRAMSGAAAAVSVVAGFGTVASAHGATYGIELNGSYHVTSNGNWAQTNERYSGEKTVIQTWTITSSCEDPLKCTGQVNSDQGWSAPLRFVDDHWIAGREINNWEPCSDGAAAVGHQKFLFWGVGADGMQDATNTTLLAGIDETVGPSGACGINKPLVIKMPMRLERV